MIRSQLLSNAYFSSSKDGDSKDFLESLDIQFDSAFMNQTHSSKLNYASFSGMQNCDSMYTDIKLLPLLVKSADCIPILMESTKGVSATHAGWRGMLGKIFEKTVNVHDINTLKISIGPHARQCCYEVEKGFEDKFTEGINRVDKKFYLDLSKTIKNFAYENKIQFEDELICTICDENYFSFRRDKTDKRQFGIIWI